MGKESVAVRVAELTAGSEAVLYACAESVEEAKPMLLGLPTKCSHKICNESVYLNSLMPAEHDVRGYTPDKTGILSMVDFTEIPNPTARGFRTIKKPKI